MNTLFDKWKIVLDNNKNYTRAYLIESKDTVNYTTVTINKELNKVVNK